MTCLRDSFNLKVTSLSQKSKNEDKTNSRVPAPRTSHPPSRHGLSLCPGLVKIWGIKILRLDVKVRLIGGGDGDGCRVISL